MGGRDLRVVQGGKSDPGAVTVTDLDAERALLGVVLVWGREVWPDVGAVEARHLWRQSHRVVWEAILRLHEGGQEVDITTVVGELGASGLAKAGGVGEVAELSNAAHSRAGAATYARRVREAWARREVAAVAAEIGRTPTLDQSARVADKIRALVEGVAPLDASVSLVEGVRRWIQSSEDDGKPAPISTGLPGVDALLGGWATGSGVDGGGLHKGELALLVAGTKVGKSAVCRHLLLEAVLAGRRCLYLPTEMGLDAVIACMIAQHAHVDSRVAMGMPGTREQWDKLSLSAHRLAACKALLRILPISCPTPSQIVAAVRAHEVDLVVVDHLQRTLPEDADRHLRRDQQLLIAMAQMQQAAIQAGCALVVAAQANAQCRAEARAPREDEVAECRNASTEAHTVLTFHRPHRYDPDADPHEAWIHQLIARRGPISRTLVRWDGPSTSLRDPGDWQPASRPEPEPTHKRRR